MPGKWTHDRRSWAFQWYRNGVAIAGPAKNCHTLVTADLGTNITCVVTAANDNGASAPSTTAPVAIAA